MPFMPASYNPGIGASSSGGLGQGLSGLGSGLSALLGYYMNQGPTDQMTQNYQAAGSPSAVYGQSGYPSAIPVGGYNNLGNLGSVPTGNLSDRPPGLSGLGMGSGLGGMPGGGQIDPQMIAQLIALWQSRANPYGGMSGGMMT
jgi:hypothetical protein